MRFAIFLLLFPAVHSQTLADTTPAALILDIWIKEDAVKKEGTVKLCQKEKCSDKDWVVLDSKKDKFRLLYKGDQFQCGPSVALHLYIESPPGEISNACSKSNTPLTATYDAKSRHSLSDYDNYRLAGRSKGAESLVFVPPDHGSIDPEKLVVRWRTRPPLKTIGVIVKTSDGTQIWSQAGIDGATGTLDSAELRQALAKIQNDSGHSRNLAITLQAPMRADDTVDFSLLSRAEVDAVEKELAAVPASPPVVRAIARASVYESAHMYDHVAAEYDDALGQAPESLTLLQVAYSASTRMGNLQRARELLRRIEASEAGTPNP